MNFPGRSEVVPIRTQRVPQTIETGVSFVSVPGAYIRYAYSRSSDSMSSQIEGQDYLCFQHNDQRLVFVVCDGVGSSFCGNLAARILGDGLLEWLWALEVAYLGGAMALSEAASSYLNRLQKQAQHEVAAYQIPDEISGLVRQALEAQRAYGSEAIFAAARIDHPGPLFPEGLVSLCWMGDTQVHVRDEEGKPVDIGGVWDNSNRWSTVHGTKGQMNAWMGEMAGISRIAAFTDGLSTHSSKVLDYGDSQLDREIHAGARLPTSDDVAFIDVVLRTPLYEGHTDPSMPDPNAECPWLEQIWNPTGASNYELRWNWKGSDRDRFVIQQTTNPALADSQVIEVPGPGTTWRPSFPPAPGHYYYRVRAVRRHGGMSPWSELRQTRVAYPPPPAPQISLSDADRSPILNWSAEGDSLEYTLEQARDPDFREPEIVYAGRSTSWSIPLASTEPGHLFYRVRAISDGGPGPWSSTQAVEVRIPPPPRPHLAMGRYSFGASVELRWQPVPGAVRYELQQVSRDSGEESIISLTDTLYTLPELGVGQFVFRVRACNDYACSEWSNEQMLAIAPPAPASAPELSIEGPDTLQMIHLQWSAVPGADEYIIETADDSGFRNARVHVEADTTMEIARREPGMLFVRVCGSNSSGQGPWSNVSTITIAPGMPGWMETTLTEGGRRLAVSWGSVGGRVAYCVEMLDPAREEAGGVTVYQGGDTQFEMARPSGLDAVQFRVRAEVSGVPGAWQSGDVLILRAAPGAPVLVDHALEKPHAVHLGWGPVSGATHYVLEVARDEAFVDTVATIPLNETAITYNAPTSGRFWFRVKAADRTQVGQPSQPVSVQVSRPAPPTLWGPGPVKAAIPFEITWHGLPGCVYYELQESASPEFTSLTMGTQRIFHPVQKFEMGPHEAGRYYFRVRSVDDQGEYSLWSDALSVDIMA